MVFSICEALRTSVRLPPVLAHCVCVMRFQHPHQPLASNNKRPKSCQGATFLGVPRGDPFPIVCSNTLRGARGAGTTSGEVLGGVPWKMRWEGIRAPHRAWACGTRLSPQTWEF